MLIQKLTGHTLQSTKLLHVFMKTAPYLISKQNWEADGEWRLGNTTLHFLTNSNRVCSTEAMASGGKVRHFGRCFVSSHDGPDTKPSQKCLSRVQAPSRLCEDLFKELYLVTVQSSSKSILNCIQKLKEVHDISQKSYLNLST